MLEDEAHVWEKLKQTINQQIFATLRLLHIFQNALTDENRGPLFLVLENEACVFLDMATDDESLKVSEMAWDDPFAGDLDAENLEWIAQVGKEEYCDLSDIPPYQNLIGETVQSLAPLYNPRGTLSGVRIKINEEYLNFYIWGGPYIAWGKTSQFLEEQGFTIG